VVIGTMVLSSDLVTLFAGEAQYQGVSDPVLAILICFLPFSFVNGLIQYVLISLDRQSTITRAFVVMAVFNLLANFLSIPYFGLYAAAVNTILSELVLYFCFKPMLRREDMSLPVITIAWRPLLAALLMGGAMLLVYPFGGSFGWILAGLIAPICYLALLWLLGTFGPDEQAMIKRVLRRS
jgi:O-antigen/teichoic acid export membrane protein